MKLVVFLIFVAVFAGTGFANPVMPVDSLISCPAGYSQPSNSNWATCYKIFTSFKNKKSAAAQCKANNGTLASIPNSFVNSYLYYLASQNDVTSFWIGTECFNGDSSNCLNDDATPFVFSNFYPGQPNVDGTCVYMSAIGRDSQQWLSFDCEQRFQFACEIAAGGATSISTTTTTVTTTQSTTTIAHSTRKLQCPSEYYQFQGMCYKKNYYTYGYSRDQQSATCRQIPGGNLATIANLDVDNFQIQNLPCGNEYLRIGLKCPNIAFDGDTSSCVWDDGTPFVYNLFPSGYPKSTSNNPCIYEYLGLWYNNDSSDFGCDHPFACSLCEAPLQ